MEKRIAAWAGENFFESDLPDLSDLPLDRIPVDDTVFAAALRRLNDELRQSDDIVAGHSNAAP